MNTTTEILKTLSDAVTASGKKLSEIGKEPIFEFLKRNETPKNLWEGIYEKLLQIHNHVEQKPKLDYSDNSHNDVKHREPRKKVFSEIKKIAG
jgi:hypothetical protein